MDKCIVFYIFCTIMTKQNDKNVFLIAAAESYNKVKPIR